MTAGGRNRILGAPVVLEAAAAAVAPDAMVAMVAGVAVVAVLAVVAVEEGVVKPRMEERPVEGGTGGGVTVEVVEFFLTCRPKQMYVQRNYECTIHGSTGPQKR